MLGSDVRSYKANGMCRVACIPDMFRFNACSHHLGRRRTKTLGNVFPYSRYRAAAIAQSV
jgi:hypothetical protein